MACINHQVKTFFFFFSLHSSQVREVQQGSWADKLVNSLDFGALIPLALFLVQISYIKIQECFLNHFYCFT